MAQPKILIWYRNDLRIHDHLPLITAINNGAHPIACYCFDDRQFGKTSFGFPKTGAFRAKFLIESVADLRNSWRSRGGDLLVRCGLPEEIIPELVTELGINSVYYYREVTSEETQVEAAVKTALQPQQVELNLSGVILSIIPKIYPSKLLTFQSYLLIFANR